VITLHKGAVTKETEMPCTPSRALIALLVLAFPSAIFGDTDNWFGHPGLLAQRPISTMSNGTIWAVNDAAKPFNAVEKGSSAASQLVPSTRLCRGDSSRGPKPWIELTGPGGEPVHINVEQIASIRSATEIPGARTQLDLASGKFQLVQENVARVMQLVSATSNPRENDEAPSGAPNLRRFN
jgi:hypothetical protein